MTDHDEMQALRSEIERLQSYDAVRRREIERLRAENRQLKKNVKWLRDLVTHEE